MVATMKATHESDRVSRSRHTCAPVRLRTGVHDALARSHGLVQATHQAAAYGIHRATLVRIKGGQEPSLAVAMRMAGVLGTPVEALFERAAAA